MTRAAALAADLDECDSSHARLELENMRMRKLLGERMMRYYDGDSGKVYVMDLVDYLPWIDADTAITETLRRM